MADPQAPVALPLFAELLGDPAWRSVELISDLHLHVDEPLTFECWRHYLARSTADAIFILGDLFEVWVGDDAATQPGFEAECAALLRAAGQNRPASHNGPRPLFFQHGNRDFLLGKDFAAQAGLTLIDDPTVLLWQGQRWLLSHGDLLCLEDTDYLAFRAQVRSAAWRQNFLARPLDERRTIARQIRSGSEARKADPHMVWADVDAAAARQWLQATQASTLIHGHTHKPAEHTLAPGVSRVVLSDWHLDAPGQGRAQVLRLNAAGQMSRHDLLGA